MGKKFYGLLINLFMRPINLFDYLAIANKYEKVHENLNEVFSADGVFLTDKFDPEDAVFVKSGENSTLNYALIYKNLYIIFSINEELNDKIVEIFIKRPEDTWTLDKDNPDLLNPVNVKFDVYVDYYVSLVKLNMNLSRCMGEEYKSGTWNKMFYRAMKGLIRTVEGYTEINQLKHAYEK